jgi:hypothetical protein
MKTLLAFSLGVLVGVTLLTVANVAGLTDKIGKSKPKSTTLHYFGGYGRAEYLRIILKHAGVDYAEPVMTKEVW